MNDSNIYISLPQSTLVFSKKVHLEDIATILCIDKDIENNINKLELFSFPSQSKQQVISIMKIIQLISKAYKGANIINIGYTETIVYYQEKKVSKKSFDSKALFLMLIAFLGTGYSIMSYNGDVDTNSLLNDLFNMFTGMNRFENPFEYNLSILFYSLGLLIGMVVFFNKGINKNSQYDPSPLQVQMRLYENDINSAIITNSQRKGNTIDID
ncbi:MAG: stage V sporulation protein AA [Lachnospiraceae bacterium]|nr:stage V sporulation protein AA [Lachnospiraceae bacterium]